MPTGTEGPDIFEVNDFDYYDLLGGDDVVNVPNDLAHGSQQLSGGAFIDGGAGFDTVNITAPLVQMLIPDYASVDGNTVRHIGTDIDWVNVERLYVSSVAYFGETATSGSWTTGDTIDEIHVEGTSNGARIDVFTGGADDEIYLGLVGNSSAGHGGGGNDLVDLSGFQGSSASAFGDEGNDSLVGSDHSDTLDGGAGDDSLDGGAGSDTAGYATAAAAVTVSLAATGPQDSVGAGIDTLVAIENLSGSTFADSLTGDGSANTLSGEGGDDLLDGGAGADLMIGGAGNDSMTGGAGDDIYVVDAGDTVTEAADVGTDEVRTSLAAYTLGANVENLTGTASTGQSLTGNGVANRLTGGAGNDMLSGGGGDDVIAGGSGADQLVGGLGNDIYTMDTSDTIVEAANAGTDEVRTVIAAYTLGANLEYLTGTSSAGQSLTGNSVANRLTGGGGNDVLAGDVGNDSLAGGTGADVLIGGTGADSLKGGAGADVFRYDAASDSTAAAPDLIGDFQVGTDKINLSGIDANTIAGGDQAFHWIGSNAFAGTGAASAGELRTYQSGSYWWVAGDTNGDGTADLVIALTPQPGMPLVQTDFVL